MTYGKQKMPSKPEKQVEISGQFWQRFLMSEHHNFSMAPSNIRSSPTILPAFQIENEREFEEIGLSQAECEEISKQEVIILENLEFDESFMISGFYFRSSIKFIDCIFREPAFFDNVNFVGDAQFHNCKFLHDVSFDRAGNSGNVEFVKCDFGGICNLDSLHLGGGLIIRDCKFLSKIELNYIHIGKGIDIQKVVFSDTFYLLHVNIGNHLRICDCVFCQIFRIRTSELGCKVVIERTIFYSSVDFEFDILHESLIIDGVKFIKETNFKGIDFKRNCSFLNSSFQNRTSFENSIFRSETSFYGSNFHEPPLFFETKIHENTNWFEVEWPSKPESQAAAQAYVHRYERLSHVMISVNKYEDFHRFFRLSMISRRKKDGFGVDYILNYAYQMICNYGFGVSRALLLWTLSIIFGASLIFLMCFRDIFTNVNADCLDMRDILSEIFQSIVISFSNLHSFLGINRVFAKNIYAKFDNNSDNSGNFSEMSILLFNIIGGVQSIIGVIILFFLLLTLRNRYRMR